MNEHDEPNFLPRQPEPHASGLIHSYQAYDPKTFPSPTAPAPDMASAAFEHMLEFGEMSELTEEELARAVRLDPSMFPRLGPSLQSLRAMLEERKRRILETYETEGVRERAARALTGAGKGVRVPKHLRERFQKALKSEQLRDLESLYFDLNDDTSEQAAELMRLLERMGEKYQVEQLAARYTFTGRAEMTVPEALDIRDELEAIDRLLEQLKQAQQTAQLAIIDLDTLSEFAEQGDMENLNRLQQQIEEYLREEAERQGLERSGQGYRLTPQAYKLFQGKLLSAIFSELEASRSGRHTGPIAGEGAVELPATKAYEFGDSATHMDVPQSFINALLRERGATGAGAAGGAERAGAKAPRGIRLRPDDIEIHRTRNNPKCATCVLMDMSGSMRYGGQYVHVKRMALAFDALIRREYPGDFLQFVEMFTFARARKAGEIVSLMPKPVSVHSPIVRLKVDMSDPRVSELRVPQHFTNIQRGLQLARQFLGPRDTPNRQVLLITDGLPTAHFEQETLYMLYPPDPRTEEATMREAYACARENITINIFLLPSWSQTHEDVQFAQRVAESTRGRVFFAGGRDLERFVLWDYVAQRRKIIG